MARNTSIDFCVNSIDNHWGATFSYYLIGPLLSCVIIIGLFGNMICLLTLNRPQNRIPKINQYLIALSVWDTALILSAFFVYNLPYLMYGRMVTNGPYVLAYPLCYMLSCASYMGSIWMVMTSAVDRYFALCRPMTHRLYVGDRNRTKPILILCSLVCLLYNAPRYLEMTVEECFDKQTKNWMATLRGSGLRTNDVYWICYKIVGGLLFYSALPFTALSYLSVRVSYEVRRLTNQSVPINKSRSMKPQKSPALPGCTPSPTPSILSRPSTATLLLGVDKRVSFSETVIEYESGPGTTNGTQSTLRRHSIITGKKPGDDPQQALNFMLIAVLLKFLVCHSLPTVLDIWESMRPNEFEGPIIDALVDASNFLVVVNSSVNVLIYLRCSRRFRYDTLKILANLFRWPIGNRNNYGNGNRQRSYGSSSTSSSGSIYKRRRQSLYNNVRRPSAVAPGSPKMNLMI